jgi:SnoaL-like domain
MTTQAATEPIPARRSLAIPRWAIVALRVLVVVAAFGAGMLVGRGTKSSPAPITGLASARVVRMIDGGFAAFDRGDWETFGAGFTPDTVFEEPDLGLRSQGVQKILRENQHYWTLGARYHRIGPVIQNGNAAAYAVSCPTCPGAWSGMDLVRFDDNGKVVHVWDIGSQWWDEP